MNLDVLGHIAYKLANAAVHRFPFPHIFVTDIFPRDFYDKLLAWLPPANLYSSGQSNYKGRKFADPAQTGMLDFMKTKEWQHIASMPFKSDIQMRFGGKSNFYTDLRLIRDQKNYSIGPHTDAPWKVLSYLFYLPPDNTLQQHGTSIYLPRDPSFRCQGGPHHPFDRFIRVHTCPFVPNSVLAFFKTDYSFHGVEPVTIECQRDLLLWNLYDAVSKTNG